METNSKLDYSQFVKIEVKEEPAVNFTLILPTELPLLVPKRENVGMMKPIVRLKNFDSKFILKAKMFERFFTCKTCDYFGRKSDKLRLHLKKHENCSNLFITIKMPEPLEKFRCDLCSVSKKFIYDIRKHMVMHLKIKPFECKNCGKTFGSKRNLLLHTNDQKRIYRCEMCDLTFKCRILQTNNFKEKHENKFQCQFCSETFEAWKKFRDHRQNHLKAKETCEVCKRKFGTNQNLKYHQILLKHGKFALQSDEDKLRCNLCEKVFLIKRQLNYHRRNHHVDEKSLTCQTCSKVFTSKYSLRYHMKTHENRETANCDLCGNSFASKERVCSHFRKMHPKGEFNCTLCTQKFSTIGNLFQHRQRHVKKGILKCPKYPKCSYETMKASYLQQHLKYQNKTISH